MSDTQEFALIGGADQINYLKAEKKKRKIYINNSEVVKDSKWYLFCKRCFDIFNSFLAIIVLSPLFLLTSLIIKLTSKGPVFFLDKRVGRYGKEIKVIKFRSMYVDAESRLKSYLTPEQYQKWLVDRKLDNDPRITRFGKLIRKTSLDELPQLFNIFAGSMSFVGPRPITRLELDVNYTKEQKLILLSATPGLTGYWQVMGRSDAIYDTGERQRLELAYFYKRGFWYDISLIFRTIPAVLKRKGAK